jgi:hypothetical protein
MSIKETIIKLQSYTGPEELTLHNGADEALLRKVEAAYGVTLPDDFKEFYRFSDGFETVEDMFNMIPLAEIADNKNRNDESLFIAEYMIYSDMWVLKINPDDCNDYKIIVESNGHELVLTNSLAEFIGRFLKGSVFGAGGLYEWREEVELQPVYTTNLKTAELLLTVFYYSVRDGLISTKEVIDWANAIITHEDEPESFFIDLSRSHDKNELISLLHAVHVPANVTVARVILGLLYHRLLGGYLTVADVITIIDKHPFVNLVTPLELSRICHFTDHIRPDEPLSGDDEMKQNLLNFLANYKELEIANYKYWVGISYRVEYLFSERGESQPVTHQQNKSKLPLWMKYATVYALPIIMLMVLIAIYSSASQQSQFYLIFFICYCGMKSGQWGIKRLIEVYRKAFR